MQHCIDSAIASRVVICAAGGIYANMSQQHASLTFGRAKNAASVAVRDVVLRSDETERPQFPVLMATTCHGLGNCTLPLYGEYSLRLEGLNISSVYFSAASASTSHVHLSFSHLTSRMELFDAASMTLDGVVAIGAEVMSSRLTDAPFLPTLYRNCNFTQGSTISAERGESVTLQNVRVFDSTIRLNQVQALTLDHSVVRNSVYSGIVTEKCSFAHTVFTENHEGRLGAISILGNLSVSASTIGCNEDRKSNYVPLFQRFGSTEGMLSTSEMDLLQGTCPIKCPPEQYSPSGGLFQCAVCGFPGVVWNATFCGRCPSGTVIPGSLPPRTEPNCAPCPPGSFAGRDTDICESCISPKYQDQPGQASCMTCGAPGHTLPAASGGTQCITCSDDGMHYWGSMDGSCQGCGFLGSQADDLDSSCSFSKSSLFLLVVVGGCCGVVSWVVFIAIRKRRLRNKNTPPGGAQLTDALLDDSCADDM